MSNVRSLSFVAASQQSVNRAQTVGSRQRFTISAWFKRASINAQQIIAGFGDNSGPTNAIAFGLDSSNRLFFGSWTGGVSSGNAVSTNTVTDTTTWHHALLAVDTTQGTASARLHLYLDGVEVTYSTLTPPTLNQSLHTTGTWYWGRLDYTAQSFWNGLLDELYYIDGQQLTPSSFTSGNPGVPRTFSGTFGTQGSFLKFD